MGKWRVWPALFALFLWAWSGLAQSDSSLQVRVSPPSLDRFPWIELWLKVYDNQGKFVHGLS
ncbi:MAG: hypothetical protein RML93_13180, partial [Anaerolineales bacterium]|nr:hypothetical protein [Anaerolineales bacterium]MDW8448226.1 hypothetical protein [Anaerolineales bacterium]